MSLQQQTSAGNPTAAVHAAVVAAPCESLMKRVLRVLNPMSIFFGPLFQRDMRIVGRRRATFWMRFGFTLGLALLVFSTMSMFLTRGFSDSPAARLQMLQSAPPLATTILLNTTLSMVLILSPFAASGSFVDERLKRTIHALAMTPLHPLHIMGNKVASRFAGVLVLTCILFPVMLLFRIFGGLDGEVVFQGLCVIVTAAFLGIAMGVYYSMSSTRASAAAFPAIGMAIFFNIFPLLWSVAIQQFNVIPPNWTMVPSPFAAMEEIHSRVVMGRTLLNSDLWALNSAFNLVAAVAFIGLGAVMLPRRFRRDALSESVTAARPRRRIFRRNAQTDQGLSLRSPPPEAQARGSAGAPAAPAPKAEAVYSEGSRTVSDHPLLWRELRQPIFSSSKSKWLISAIVLGSLTWAYIGAGLDSESMSASVSIVLVIVILLFSVAGASGSITSEVESQAWPLLMTAPLRPRQVLWPKALGGFFRIRVAVGLLTLHLAIVCFFGSTHPAVFFFVLPSVICASFMLNCAGVYHSLVSRRSSGALVSNFFFAAAFWALFPMLALMLFAQRTGPEPLFRTIFYVTNPFSIAGQGAVYAAEGHMNRLDAGTFGGGIGPFTMVTVLHCGLMIFMGWGFIRVAQMRYPKFAFRSA